MPRGKTSTKLCDICNKMISLFAYNRHVKSHTKIKKELCEINKSILVERSNTADIIHICSFCKRKNFKSYRSLRQHEIRCPANINRYEQQFSEATRRKLSISSKTNNYWKNDTEYKKYKHSIIMKNAVINNPESYTSNNVCGRSKICYYKNMRFHSTWEVVFAEWLDACEIKWLRCTVGIPYTWNNSIHTYFPDFYLIEYDLYVEIKGYQTERDLLKWESVSNILIIRKREISLIRQRKFNVRMLLMSCYK